MKHKRRSGNPLSHYRRIQREIREIFDPFTAKHCPTCVTPCCVKPTRVTPVDVALAVSVGHAFPHLGHADPYLASVEHASHRLGSGAVALPMAKAGDTEIEFCEYLDHGRCSFPDDLRPYGCTAYVCGPMYENLPEAIIKRIRYLVRQLDEAHAALLRALRDSGMRANEDEG